jgi:FkbM family methyltransferase
MSVVNWPSRQRATRLAEFCGVGSVGVAIDLAITLSLLGRIDPLAANACGFLVAVTHNFCGNYLLTFDRPAGRIPKQYVSYVGLHSITFGIRVVVLTAILSATALPATAATLLGIGAAALVNFLGAERIFDNRRAWFRVGDALNHVAHTVFDSRVREYLLASGLYSVVFGIYAQGLVRVTPDSATANIREASATLETSRPTETVSVRHTLKNEEAVLQQFVDDVCPGDRVLDVGANLGVFSALAIDIGAEVEAVEPHPATARQLQENCPGATVHKMALGSGVGEVQLDVARDSVGSQRAAVGNGDVVASQLPGDRLQAPDVLKIDVEGAEAAVLGGFERALSATPPRVIFVETHGDQESSVLERLVRAGYQVDEIGIGADQTMIRARR